MKPILLLSLAGASLCGEAIAAEPFRAPLISVEKNLRVDSLEISGKKITPQNPKWSVRKLTLHGGKQEGVELVVLDNGKLQFTVVPTRGLGVLEAKLGDVRLGWHSPVKESVHPRHINLQSRGGLVAMIQGPDKKTYIVHPGDKFLDGTIKSIIPQGLVIIQEVNDPLSLVKQREIRKLLRSLEDAKG